MHAVLGPPRSFYYDCLMRPNAKSVTTALRKVKDLPFSMIANGHGPILKWVMAAMMCGLKGAGQVWRFDFICISGCSGI